MSARISRAGFGGIMALMAAERLRIAPGIRLLARDSICALIKNAINIEFD